MKLLSVMAFLLALGTANAATSCIEPSGKFTSKEMVLNQFVFNNGNPNWGDWCYEVSSSQESKLCNNELDQWDKWVSCSKDSFTESCKMWADKENFTSSDEEYNEFVQACVETNFRDTLTNSNYSCEITSPFADLTNGVNKEVICAETIRALSKPFYLKNSFKLQISIDARDTYSLRLNQIMITTKNQTIYRGSGVFVWNPDGEQLYLD